MRYGSGLLIVAALLLVGACAKPAKVTLFGDRTAANATSADRTAKSRQVYPGAKRRRGGNVSAAPLAARRGRNSSNAASGAARKQYRAVPTGGYHRVAAKETVYAISRLYGVPVRGLIQANSLKAPYGLRIGQKVRLPTQRTHFVVKGETVYGIARRFSVSIKELVSLNGIAKPYVVRLGETLLLPDSEAVKEDTQFVRTPSEPRAADAPPVASMAPNAQSSRVRRAEKATIKPALAAIPRPARLSRKGFLWPLSGRLLSRFGAKGKGLYNDGINIAAKRGAPVRAAQNGVVVYRGNELRGFGNLLLIKHANGYMTAYGHNSVLLVKRGEKVRRGQVIARAGSTGNVARPQVHFEIRKRRRAVNPLKYLGRQRVAAWMRQYG
jgi:murein DD-endopeptidase MepM/ murein hydrolase activator NlpD